MQTFQPDQKLDKSALEIRSLNKLIGPKLNGKSKPQPLQENLHA